MIIKFPKETEEEPPVSFETSELDETQRIYKIVEDIFVANKPQRHALNTFALDRDSAEDYLKKRCIHSCKVMDESYCRWSQHKHGYDFLVFKKSTNQEIPLIGYKLIKFEVFNKQHHKFESA